MVTKLDFAEITKLVEELMKGAGIINSLYRIPLAAVFTSTRVKCYFSVVSRINNSNNELESMNFREE